MQGTTQGTAQGQSQSYLYLYSIGIAAENLTPGDTTLHITPIEKLTFVDGELKANPISDTVTGTDATGKSFSTSATTDNTISAKWLPMGSNRHTAPNVRRGERVAIWRFGDLDTFMWTDLGWDQNYRKLETVTYVFNATQDQTDNSTSTDNCYYVEVSTHNGTITLKTSKANGEATAYTVQFNAKAGTFTFADDLNQMFFIDSVNHRFFMQNADKTTFLMDHQNFSLTCQDTFTLSATNNINISTKNFQLNATNVTLQIQQQLQVSAATIQGTATQSVNISSPSINIGGVQIANGNVQMGTLNATSIQCDTVNATTSVTAPNLKYN
jgi:hypothetical protein